MVIPSSRTRRLRKLITMGAAKAINEDVTLDRKPECALIAEVTAPSDVPKRLESICFPVVKRDELGSAILFAALPQERSPEGTKSRSFLSVLGLSA
jgi:hypothetical protein